MKKTFKRFRQFMNDDSINLYLKVFYKWQIRNKLLKKTDTIDEQFKEEIKAYWNKFNIKISTDWHKWYYSRNGVKDVRYIPEDIFYCVIEPYYNRVDFVKAYSDKSLHSIWFSDVKRPITIAKNMNGICYDDSFNPITLDELLDRCSKRSSIIIKPSIESGGGKNISFVNAENSEDMRNKTYLELNDFKKDYVIQEILEQHETINQLNPTSINTIRVTSLLKDNKVNLLTSHIRIGVDNSKYDHYGIVCGIQENGQLKDFACKYKQGDVFTVHPQGYEFKGTLIPSFNKMKEIVKREHLKFGHFRLMSWDFAIDKMGDPVLIEVNLRWQGLNHHQLTIGPLFGDLTDEVLEEVYGKKAEL
ncbi:sugar-transfer associated ATP-grasp domain-containing protein [Sutcliffiella deserti]|uniref:sugar-transfer associated ATP-grasp domain-containing protein n=1 Tax=Sutcliffiella deserti TaxID=2875501 RepID=UPI001CBF74F1|nr:sugar-transfer associated ATP-grasp domain-containing protein [Sutcliffiella deserti]